MSVEQPLDGPYGIPYVHEFTVESDSTLVLTALIRTYGEIGHRTIIATVNNGGTDIWTYNIQECNPMTEFMDFSITMIIPLQQGTNVLSIGVYMDTLEIGFARIDLTGILIE